MSDKNKIKWENWAKNVICETDQLLKPASLEELQKIVKENDKIRVVGSGHSFNAQMCSTHTILDLENLNKVIKIDKEKKQVTAESGIKLKCLNKVLVKNKLGFALLGNADSQVSAGLMATATHGSSVHVGTVSDTVVAVQIILADGSLKTIDSSNEAELKAARCCLGMFGVIYSVTFQLVDVYNLEVLVKMTDQKFAMDPKLRAEHFSVDLLYFPFVDTFETTILDYTSKPADKENPFLEWFNDIFIRNIVVPILLKILVCFPGLVPTFMKLIAWFSGIGTGKPSVKPYIKVYLAPSHFPALDMEYALPIDKGNEALEIFRKLVKKYTSKEDPFYINLPVNIRFLKGENKTLIGHNVDRDTCYFDVSSYAGFKNYEPFFKELADEFIKIGGRPHWGKIFYKNPKDMYENFDEFLKIRNELDPKGKFLNPFLTKLVDGENVG